MGGGRIPQGVFQAESCEDHMEEIEDEAGLLDDFVDEELDCSKDPIEDNFCKYGGFAIYCYFI